MQNRVARPLFKRLSQLYRVRKHFRSIFFPQILQFNSTFPFFHQPMAPVCLLSPFPENFVFFLPFSLVPSLIPIPSWCFFFITMSPLSFLFPFSSLFFFGKRIVLRSSLTSALSPRASVRPSLSQKLLLSPSLSSFFLSLKSGEKGAFQRASCSLQVKLAGSGRL